MGLGTGGRCCICARQTLHVHSHDSPDDNTFLREMTSWPKIGLRRSMYVYLKNNRAKCHCDLTQFITFYSEHGSHETGMV